MENSNITAYYRLQHNYDEISLETSEIPIRSKYTINNENRRRHISCLLYTKTGKLLSGDDDNSISVYIREEISENYKLIKSLTGHTNDVYCIIESKEPNRVLSCSWDNTIREWNLITMQCIKVIVTTHKDGISKIMLINYNKLISCGYDSLIKIWKTNDEDICIKTLKGHTDAVISITDINKNLIASASYDKTVRFWDIKRSKCVERLTIYNISCFSNNSMYHSKKESILYIGGNGIINIIDTKCFQVIRTINFDYKGCYINCISQLKNGAIAFGFYNFRRFGQIAILKNCSSKLKNINYPKNKPIYSIITLTEGEFVSGDNEGNLTIWEY